MVCDGLGGAIVIEIACDGCQLRSWLFRSSLSSLSASDTIYLESDAIIKSSLFGCLCGNHFMYVPICLLSHIHFLFLL